MSPALISLRIVLACLATTASAEDPTHTDGGKYKVLLENEAVRVLEYRDQPGEKTRTDAPETVPVVARPVLCHRQRLKHRCPGHAESNGVETFCSNPLVTRATRSRGRQLPPNPIPG